jgi:4-hydroxythreonine-4-phosphate dehydrogenase
MGRPAPARPVIALTSGEPAGIGPDICLSLARQELDCRCVVLADEGLLRSRAAQLGVSVSLRAYDPARPGSAGELEVLHLPLAAGVVAGRLDPANGPYVLDLIERAAAGCRD